MASIINNGEIGTQIGLFDQETPEKLQEPIKTNNNNPLAYRARPRNLEEFKGQKHLFDHYPFLKEKNPLSMIICGPPGSGKTTLAFLLADQSNKDFYKFSAVLGGVNDLKKLIKRAIEIKEFNKKEAIIFIDEIHRFNKAQQDALLPYVEEGVFTLIGATTENPRTSINRALLSRIHVIKLVDLEQTSIKEILINATKRFKIEVSSEVLDFISDYSGGDARSALNYLEIIEKSSASSKLTVSEIKKLILENAQSYDKNQDRHYDVISAYIKSLRGSDPDASLLWLAVMLNGGEDPVFIARRLVIFASEDIGNADPSAITLAISTLQAVLNIGMPEARICLAQATTYLASTYKSNASYKGINKAMKYVQSNSTIHVPDHLKNYPPKSTTPYKYPHDFKNHYVLQKYANDEALNFYCPTNMGKERFLKERLVDLGQAKGDFFNKKND